MDYITHVKKQSIEMKELTKGYFKGEMLPGSMPGVTTNRCTLKAGMQAEPERYANKAVSIFVFSGIGKIKTTKKTFRIVERCLFCPDFDNHSYQIEADSDIEYLELIQDMTNEDWKHYEMYHIVLPWFNSFSNWHLYTEGFRDEELKSYAILHQYYVSRMSLGEVVGPGEAKLEPHIHPELYQWFYGLPETDTFIFKAGEEMVEVEPGDWICIPNNVSHIVSPKKTGDFIDYVWFEMVVPGKEMCPYFY